MTNYLKELDSMCCLDMLIIGQDPYKEESEQLDIAFCNSTFDKLFDKNAKGTYSSGKYILNSLGYYKEDSRMKDHDKPETFFYSLLRDEKIGFINISPNRLLECDNYSKQADFNINDPKVGEGIINNSEIISRLIPKTEKIFVIGKITEKIFRKTVIFNYKSLLRKILNKPSDKVSFLIHPSEKNKKKEEWKDVWSENKKLLFSIIDSQ